MILCNSFPVDISVDAWKTCPRFHISQQWISFPLSFPHSKIVESVDKPLKSYIYMP